MREQKSGRAGRPTEPGDPVVDPMGGAAADPVMPDGPVLLDAIVQAE